MTARPARRQVPARCPGEHRAHQVPYEFQVYVLPSARAVARCAAATVADEARRAITRRGRFVIAVPGGATPLPLFAELAAAHQRLVDWSAVTFVWIDERLVPHESDDSNAGSASRGGLARLPGARLLPMPVGSDPAAGARAYEAALRDLLRTPAGRPAPLDMAVLGVGGDGHVASLFPGSPALDARRRWVVPAAAPSGPLQRLTMTLPLLRAARIRLVLATGAAKRAIVARALAPSRNADLLPIHLVAATVRPTAWLVDRAAAPDWLLEAT